MSKEETFVEKLGGASLEELEAMWLEALARDTTIPVPVMKRARSGEHVLPMQGFGIPSTWNASLMSWVPGRDLGHYLTER